MFGKIAFALATMVFLVLIGLHSQQLVEFTFERIANGDSVASYWGFWLLWLGPVVIGLSAVVGGINAWLHPNPLPKIERLKARDSWILPR